MKIFIKRRAFAIFMRTSELIEWAEEYNLGYEHSGDDEVNAIILGTEKGKENRSELSDALSMIILANPELLLIQSDEPDKDFKHAREISRFLNNYFSSIMGGPGSYAEIPHEIKLIKNFRRPRGTHLWGEAIVGFMDTIKKNKGSTSITICDAVYVNTEKYASCLKEELKDDGIADTIIKPFALDKRSPIYHGLKRDGVPHIVINLGNNYI